MSVGEYENEPVRGLPEYLPDDETLVWQGEPDFRTMARRVFHVRTVSIYFLTLIALHLAFQISSGGSALSALLGSSWMLGMGLAAIAILTVLAWAYARSTVYTLTNKRLVIRSGVAVPMMVNIPLSTVEAADMREFKDGSGDIILSLDASKRLSYMMIWPNVRSWKFKPVLPALRSLANVKGVAEALGSVVQSTPQQSPAAGSERRVERTTVRTTGERASSGQMLGAS